MRQRWSAAMLAVVSLFPVDVCLGQEEILALPLLRSPVRLDGTPDEAAWEEALSLPMIAAVPVFGATPSEPTEVLVGYDETYLYVAGRFADSDSSGIQVGSLTRDREGSDDAFELVLDTYDDNENAVGFRTNPAAIRIDFSVLNDGEDVSSRIPSHDPAWNTFWDVEARITEGGWTMEMRIPLSSLRFQTSHGETVMGLIVRRTIARKNEEITFPGIPPEWNGGYRKPSLAAGVALRGITPSRPVYLTPFLLTGLEQTAPAEEETGDEGDTDLRREVGADLKIPLADNLVLDLTANTDFAQTEVDAEQVNRGRFSLFFPEKRQFFLERAGIFDLLGIGDTRLFHSRRIGLSDDGVPIQILGGGRLVGRLGEWDLGALEMQTASSPGLPSENFGVVRLRRRVLNPESYTGFMMTSRMPTGRSGNVAYGVDGRMHFGGTTYASGSFFQSLSGTRGSFASTAGVLTFERRARRGLSHAQSLGWTGESFDPGIGFVDRGGIVRFDGALDYRWIPDRDHPLYLHGPGIEIIGISRTGGNLESLEVAPGWLLRWKSGVRVDLEVNGFYEKVEEPFFLGDAEIPVGDYRFFSARGMVELPSSWRFGGRVYARIGEVYDGRWYVLFVRPSWRASERFEASLDYDRTRSDFTHRGERFDSDILRLRLNGAVSAALSLSAFVQYNSRSDDVSSNAQLRYNFAEGRDLFVIYNEELTVDPDTHRISARGERSVLLKFTYTFMNR